MAITATNPILRKKSTAGTVPASLEAGLGMGATAANPYTPGHWSQSLVIRTFLGVVFALGLTLAFLRIGEGVLILIEEPATFWTTFEGFLVRQGGQTLAVFIGAFFAAAGRRHTLILGLAIGAIAGFGRMAFFDPPPNVMGLIYALMPTWNVVAGVLGAMLGGMIWQPPGRERARMVSSMTGYESEQSVAQFLRRAVVGMIFANVRWLRILIAAIVILAALRFTGDGVNYLIRTFDLREVVNKAGLQKGFLIVLLQAVTVFVAGTLAGMSQNHGLAHGFWIGVITGVANLLLRVFLPREDILLVTQILTEIAWVFCLSLLGGGFGALVMPPMIYLARKRRPVLPT